VAYYTYMVLSERYGGESGRYLIIHILILLISGWNVTKWCKIVHCDGELQSEDLKVRTENEGEEGSEN
jgi:hypothetical protein